jgi:type VI secretion system protein ImpK
MSDYGDSYQLAPFREFYAEIVHLKALARAGAWVSPRAGADSNSPPGDAPGQTGTWVYYPDAFSDADFDDGARITSLTLTPKTNSSTALMRTEPGGNGSQPAVDYSELLPPSDSFRVISEVWQRLVALFQHQAITVWKNGGSHGAELYKEAQYVMIVLADEIFLHMVNWEGKRAWGANLLEANILRSHASGQVFFDKLDRLLRLRDPASIDLAAIYLMALSLGFEGKYRDADDGGKLAYYRRQLFIFICGREPDLDDEKRYVFPEAYRHILREESHRKLSDPRRWFVVLCLVLIVYVAATQAFWVQFTRELNTVNQSLTKIIGELKARP